MAGSISVDQDYAPGSSPTRALLEYLKKELTRDYSKTIVQKGRRLSPSQIEIAVEGEETRGIVDEKGMSYKVFMTVPVFTGDRGYSFIKCSCLHERVLMDDQRCHHMWAVQNALLDFLETREEASQSLGEGDHWETLFAGFQRESPQVQHHLHQAEVATRLIWEISDDLKITPYMQSTDGSGGWDRGRRLSWLEVQTNERLWALAPEALPIAARWQAMHASMKEQDHHELCQILADLGSCDRIFKPAPSRELIAVRRGQISIDVVRDNDHLTVVPLMDGIRAERWIAIGSVGFAVWQPHPLTLLWGQVDEKVANLLQQLTQKPLQVANADREKLFQHLVALESYLPIQMETSLSSSEVLADEHLYLRITPLKERGARIELFCRPSPQGAYFFPGWGSTYVLDTTDPAHPISVKRDLEDERLVARRLVKLLDLDLYHSPHDSIWFLPQDEDALSLAERLEALPPAFKLVVEWPKESKPGLSAKSFELADPLDKQVVKVTVTDRRDWFDLEGGVNLGDDEIGLRALLEAIRFGRRYIQLPSGRWSRITSAFQERLQNLQELVDTDGPRLLVSPADLPAWQDIQKRDERLVMEGASSRWQQWQTRLQSLQSEKYDEDLPDGLHATLRSYQQEGYRWLCRRYESGMGACLADDMGLGKTIQTLAILLKKAAAGPSLVVAPTSVIPNWDREIRRFAPSLKVKMFHQLREQWNPQTIGSYDVVLVSYGLLLRESAVLCAVPWNILVLDEAQALKNNDSKTTGAVREFQAQWKLALSGTPIENHLGELWSLFQTLTPGLLGSWQDFKRRFAMPIERFGDVKAQTRLKNTIHPFLLRRLKEDYLTELPPKTEMNLFVELSPEERRYYDAWRLEAFEKLQNQEQEKPENSELAEDTAEPESTVPEAQKRFEILGMLTKLRQISCDARLLDDTLMQRSAKTLQFRALIQELRDGGHAVLVFSQFTSYLDLLERELKEMLIPYGRLDGSCSIQQRQSLVEQFQDGDFEVFLISLKAGGTGLNLTRANYVIHMDPWWNPAAEDQATDRAHRMGQQKPLTVYRLVASNTVEDKILHLHRWKRDLLDQVVTPTMGKEGGALALSDLMALLDDNPESPSMLRNNDRHATGQHHRMEGDFSGLPMSSVE